MSAVRERDEIEDAYTWDLESIFASDEEWEAAFGEAEETIDELTAYEGAVMESADTLTAALHTYERVMREVSMIFAYARMRRDEDTANDHYQALTSRARTLYSEAETAASFIEPEIQAVDWKTIAEILASNPDVAEYEHFLEDIHRMREHTRSAEVEGIFADLGEVVGGGEIYTMLTNADMTFPTVTDADGESVEITLANFVELQKEPDRAFRQDVYEEFYDEWETVRNAVATSYATSVKADVKLAQQRGYETAREAALDSANVPVEVYDTLVATIKDHLDVLQRHANLKERALGVDELGMWDIYMPVARGDSPEISYDKATEHILEAVEPLGEAYVERLRNGIDSRWVDVYETPNKSPGAYSGGTYDTQPFILMNYQDTVKSMFTLAHEFGHSLHSELTSEEQPYVYSQYEIFVAEVASTVNETLLTHHLLETIEDDRFRRHVLDQYLENFRGTLYRQVLFADFEHQVHQLIEDGEALTADRLDARFRSLKTEFYGESLVDDRIAREWMRIPHFYRAFYVYQYSTGISAAVALAQDILEVGEPAAERYREFLRSGSREYPLDLLDAAGVDMRTAAPIEAAVSTYDGFLDEMEVLLDA